MEVSSMAPTFDDDPNKSNGKNPDPIGDPANDPHLDPVKPGS